MWKSHAGRVGQSGTVKLCEYAEGKQGQYPERRQQNRKKVMNGMFCEKSAGNGNQQSPVSGHFPQRETSRVSSAPSSSRTN